MSSRPSRRTKSGVESTEKGETGSPREKMDEEDHAPPEKKKPPKEEVGRGLRHFSLKVCLKVEAKGTTNYAEVADELVAEYKIDSEAAGAEISLVDQKNIRRRVYDALNVLRAMNVISKVKKAITWVGLPSDDVEEGEDVVPGVTSIVAAAAASSIDATSAASAAAVSNSTNMLAQRLAQVRDTREAVMRRIGAKRQQHEELMAQQIWYRNLLSRNMRHAEELLAPHVERLTLPFIIINTRSHTDIQCSVSPTQAEYFFNFSEPFEIHDDNEILKRMHHRLVLVSQPSGGMTSPTPKRSSRDEDAATSAAMFSMFDGAQGGHHDAVMTVPTIQSVLPAYSSALPIKQEPIGEDDPLHALVADPSPSDQQPTKKPRFPDCSPGEQTRAQEAAELVANLFTE